MIPAGRYLAEKVRRKTIPEDEGGGIEFTFRIGLGEYRGEVVTTRLWAAGRIERADELGKGELVEIVVGLRVAASGRRFSTIHDFRRLSDLTAADAVRGEYEAASQVTQGDVQETCGTFKPYPLLTEDEFALALDNTADEEGQVREFPLLDDGTAERVTTLAQAGTGPFMSGKIAAIDDCDADDDADCYRWGITQAGSAMPVAALIATEEGLKPLPAAEAGIAVPMSTSLCQYTSDLPSYMAAHRQSCRGYSGPAWSRWLFVRLLSETGLDHILGQARLIAKTCAKLGVSTEQIIGINNWNCGLSLLIPSCAVDAAPQVGYEKAVGHFVQALADLACLHALNVPTETRPNGSLLPADPNLHVPIDRRLYGPVAVHPMLNSPDTSGQLFAVAFSYDELFRLETKGLKELAKAPRPIPTPTWRANPVEELVDLWRYAVEAEQLRSNRFSWLVSEKPFVSADTYDWMLHGCDPEMAPKRLFRAALNLLRIGCSRNAVTALLHPAAHLSGLDCDSLEWGVDCALKALVPEGIYLGGDE